MVRSVFSTPGLMLPVRVSVTFSAPSASCRAALLAAMSCTSMLPRSSARTREACSNSSAAMFKPFCVSSSSQPSSRVRMLLIDSVDS